MSGDTPLNIVICWHMHQPQYCDLISGTYQLPWSYLHATKDYIDMAAHLEAAPEARAVVNFAPVLLEQLSDYAGQVNGFLSENKALRDPLLAALACPVLPAGKEQRMALVSACLRVNELRSIRRFSSLTRNWRKWRAGSTNTRPACCTSATSSSSICWSGTTLPGWGKPSAAITCCCSN